MRFGDQSYDAIETLSAKRGSGFKLTDQSRPNRVAYGEGKQTKNRQSKKGNSENSPITGRRSDLSRFEGVYHNS
jgi:hypothetical protein